MDETQPRAMVPVVLISGTGDGGPQIQTGTVATTASMHTPDLLIRTISPVVALAIRFAYTFGGQLAGLITAAMTPEGKEILYTGDFWSLLLTCSSLSLPGAVLVTIKDAVTMLKGLESKYPLLTGNV